MNYIYEVYGIKADREKDICFGSYYTPAEAEAKIAALKDGPWASNKPWSEYHDEFVVRQIENTCTFKVPPGPTPRELFEVSTEKKPNAPGTWDSNIVTIKRQDGSTIEFERNYWALYGTFEPFRQGDKYFALVAPHYTATSVMDLETGEIIAKEEPGTFGFCPVGFYVPDWWDIWDDSLIPGSRYWSPSMEKPDGSFGFVWGCIWGDDSSWKVQYLDLSQVQDGIIKRDERFGYIELATIGKDPKEFIRYSPESDRVTFALEVSFERESGAMSTWQAKSFMEHHESVSQ